MFQVEVLLFYRLLPLLCCISGKINIVVNAKNMLEGGFSLIRIFPYKGRLVYFDFVRENTGQRKLVFWHILRNVNYEKYINPFYAKWVNSEIQCEQITKVLDFYRLVFVI